MRAVARQRVRTSVAQLRTHPSILAWNLANEVGGQGHAGGQAAYIDGMARELHRTDPGRLVALDIWGTHAPRADGLMYHHIDVLGLTNYSGWYDHTFSSQRAIARVIRANVAALRRASSPSSAPRPTAATRLRGRAATRSSRGCWRRTSARTRRCRS
jgi:hypothetical protein